MNIENIGRGDRETPETKTKTAMNYHTIKYGIFSVVAHVAIVAILLSGALFADDKLIDSGDDSIKAVMVDLSQIAAPEQSMAENPQIANNIENRVDDDKPKEPTPEETAPEEIVTEEKIPDQPIPEEKAPEEPVIEQPVVKETPVEKPIEKPIEKPTEKPPVKKNPQKQKTKQPKSAAPMTSETSLDKSDTASSSPLRQEVASNNLAQTSSAPSISNNTNYSETPSPISRNQPEYPRRALDMQLEGYVVAKYDVTSEGRVENIRIIESIPNNVFNRSVIMAMKTWKYKPIAAKDLTIKIVFNRNKTINLESN